MKSESGIRVLLFFLILVTGSFDRHLSGYFHGEVKMLMQHTTIPLHHEVPGQFCDHHEDITLKPVTTILPVPIEAKLNDYCFVRISIPISPPLCLWQPPENNS
jgi:hypothetical protein